MQSKPRPGRHRKPTSTRAIAARAAISAGGAVAAVLLAGGPATAAAVPAGEQKPAADPPCTGTALDAIVGPLTGADCNSNPEDSDGPDDPPETTPPGTDPPPGGAVEAAEPPEPAPAAGVIPLPCTGSPLDSLTTCATAGHNATGGGDRGDAAGADTPSYGQPGGEDPPAA